MESTLAKKIMPTACANYSAPFSDPKHNEIIRDFTTYSKNKRTRVNRTVTVKYALTSIYNLNYVKELQSTFATCDPLSSSSSSNNNNNCEQEEVGICQRCVDVLADLYKSFNEFNQLRKYDSYINNNIQTLRDLLHRVPSMINCPDPTVHIDPTDVSHIMACDFQEGSANDPLSQLIEDDQVDDDDCEIIMNENQKSINHVPPPLFHEETDDDGDECEIINGNKILKLRHDPFSHFEDEKVDDDSDVDCAIISSENEGSNLSHASLPKLGEERIEDDDDCQIIAGTSQTLKTSHVVNEEPEGNNSKIVVVRSGTSIRVFRLQQKGGEGESTNETKIISKSTKNGKSSNSGPRSKDDDNVETIVDLSSASESESGEPDIPTTKIWVSKNSPVPTAANSEFINIEEIEEESISVQFAKSPSST